MESHLVEVKKYKIISVKNGSIALLSSYGVSILSSNVFLLQSKFVFTCLQSASLIGIKM